MIVVSSSTVDAIRSKRVRLRVIELPVRYRRKLGEADKGARIPCPVKPNHVYTLQAASLYTERRQQAERQPHRKRAVLWLIDECSRPAKTVTITVLDITQTADQTTWIVRFLSGDQAVDDTPVFLGRGRDYTLVAAQAIDRLEVMTPFKADLERARERAREKRDEPASNGIAAARAAHGELKRAMLSMKARNRLRLIERETKRLAEELSVAAGATLSPSDRVQSQLPAEADGEHPPRDARSPVSLEPAA